MERGIPEGDQATGEALAADGKKYSGTFETIDGYIKPFTRPTIYRRAVGPSNK